MDHHRQAPSARVTGVVAALATALATFALGPGLVPAGTAAPPRTGESLDVLVVGDSYSAGNGATGTTYGPDGCYRNTTHWSEKYASGLRDQGYSVTLTNHACSGGRTPDVHTPRAMDTQSGRTTPAPAGVTTPGQADAYLRGGKTNPRRGIHRFEHVSHQFAQIIVKIDDGCSGGVENGVT